MKHNYEIWEVLWRNYKTTPVSAISALALEKHSSTLSPLLLHEILQFNHESSSQDYPELIWPLSHQWESQGPPGLAPPPWDAAAWHPSLPPFLGNAFLSLQSPHVQILILYPGSVQVPLSWLQPFLNSFSYLRESVCSLLMSHGIWFTVLFWVLFTLCLVLYSYLYIHPRPYLLILTLKAWVLCIIVFQIGPCTINTLVESNPQC